jgi:hypothetical protein
MTVRLFAALLTLSGIASCSGDNDPDAPCDDRYSCTSGTCIVKSNAPTCRCTPEQQSSSIGCFLVSADQNDTMATATPLVASNAFEESIIGPKPPSDPDRDFFTFTAVPRHFYRFTCIAGTLDGCAVRMIGPEGSSLATGAGPRGQTVPVLAKATTRGPWFVEVSATLPGQQGSYTFRLEDFGPDEHGDSASEATPIMPGAKPGSGTLEVAEDLDAFSFEALAGHVYRFGCSPCRIKLMDSTGLLLAQGAEERQDSGIQSVFFRAPTSQRLVIEVSPVNTGDFGAYSYLLEDWGLDDHGDSRGTATAIVPSPNGVDGRIQLRDDVDMFSFQAEAGRNYHAACLNGTAQTCTLEVLDANGSASPVDTHWWGTVFRTPRTETHYVRVRADVPGTYVLSLRDLGLDEASWSDADPAPVALGDTSGVIAPAGDWDVFAFAADSRRLYTVTCSGKDGGYCRMELANATFAKMGGDNPTYQFAVQTGGTVLIRVTGAALDYQVSIREIPDPEGNNGPEYAQPAELGVLLQGSLDAYVDSDCFAFALRGGQIYRLSGSLAPLGILGPNGSWFSGGPGFTANETGTWYVCVYSSGPGLTFYLGAYSLRLD